MWQAGFYSPNFPQEVRLRSDKPPPVPTGLPSQNVTAFENKALVDTENRKKL